MQSVHIECEHIVCTCDECTAGMSFGVAKAVRFVMFVCVVTLVAVNADIAHKLIYAAGEYSAGLLHWAFLALGPLLGWWLCRLSRF